MSTYFSNLWITLHCSSWHGRQKTKKNAKLTLRHFKILFDFFPSFGICLPIKLTYSLHCLFLGIAASKINTASVYIIISNAICYSAFHVRTQNELLPHGFFRAMRSQHLEKKNGKMEKKIKGSDIYLSMQSYFSVCISVEK